MEEQMKPMQEGEQDYRHKLDGVMRRLLEMDEAAVRQRVRQDQQRLRRLKKRIAQDVDRAMPAELARRAVGMTPLKASASEVEAIRSQLLWLRERELLPDRVVATVVRDSLRRLRVRAIINFAGNREDLEGLGLQVRAQAQDVFTVVGTLAQLKTLVAQPACQRLRAPRMFFPVVENASTQAEIADVHNPRLPDNPNGYQGNGILIGIIDSALDVTHHTFRDPGGTHGTRLLYYWVQSPYTRPAFNNFNYANLTTLPGQDPAAWSAAAAAGTRPSFNGLNYGRLYTEADINTAIGSGAPYGTGNNQICCEPWYGLWMGDLKSEHGTHCAGIAAGNGREANWNTNPTHVGAAPQATIIYVCTQLLSADVNRDGTWEDAILDGIDFCLRAAAFQNMPVVISISQGNNLGPHNGASDIDQAIDNLLNSFFNRSVVLAAGNDNNENGYRSGSLAAGSTVNFTLTAVSDGPIYLDIWYSGPELDYRISYGGANSGWRTVGQEYDDRVGGHHIVADRDADPGGGLRNIRMFFEDAFLNCVYTIDLRNPHAAQAADYHAWAGSQGWWATVAGSSQNARTLSDSACSKSALTVGACQKVNPASPASGEQITTYSGAGPTLDGRIKPDIVAVGDSVNSAASDQASGWVMMSGTSMATPLVAGAVALLFDAYRRPPLNLQLNQDTIKALLIQHANRLNLHLDPAQVGYVAEQRNRYGNGRLRMIEAIDQSQPPVDVDVWVRTADDDYGQEPYTGECFCGAPDIRVCQAGTDNEITQLTWGTTYDVKVTVRNLGDSNAVSTAVHLKYTTPWTAPNSWFEAEDAGNNKLSQTVTVNAMNQAEVLFHWRPEAAELNAQAGQTHFCLLAEVDHAADRLVFAAPTDAGGSAWATNIKGTNNVALHNLHIQ
ncbi:MAG: S8 family serine peptidase [Anaerolineae bacterium]|nr:S8 family serine peptidase [Anaerolineae bacterium]